MEPNIKQVISKVLNLFSMDKEHPDGKIRTHGADILCQYENFITAMKKWAMK